MRNLLPSALATLVTCLPALAQSFGFQIDTAPPGAPYANSTTEGNWQDPWMLTEQYSANGFRIRILAEPGTWVRPLLDFKLDEQLTNSTTRPSWLVNNPWLENIGTPTTLQGLKPAMANVYGVAPSLVEIQGYENVVIPRPDSFMRWLNFAVKNGSPTTVSTGVQQWCQPVLTMQSSPYRLWTANPTLWQTGNGPVSNWIWTGALREEAPGTSTLSFYRGLRYAILEQASFQGHPEYASQLMNTPEWNDVISDILVRLAIQIFGLKPPQSQGASTDPTTDPINLPEMPLTFVTPSWSFRVELPEPRFAQFGNLANAILIAGGVYEFSCDEGQYPMMLRVPTATNGVLGETEVMAYAAPSLTNPAAYRVRVPTNYVPGPIAVKHGDMTQWMDAQTYALLPN